MCKAVEEYGDRRELANKIENIKSLMTNLKFSVEQAMQALNISPEDQIVIKGILENPV